MSKHPRSPDWSVVPMKGLVEPNKPSVIDAAGYWYGKRIERKRERIAEIPQQRLAS
jgi:hypothetical protein